MGCGGSTASSEPVFSLDFTDNAKGMDSDVGKELYTDLQAAPAILDRLRSFKGCGEHIREAITNPSPENEEAAWAAVVPSVDILKEFYEFSVALEKALKKLLEVLCAEAKDDDDLADHQALTRKLAQIFDFVLRFDDMKMTNPAIQNDFSYYRRILNRIKLSNKKDAGITVNDELANAMSLFFAYPTPMMNSLIKVTSNVTTGEPAIPIETVSKFLARMSNSCHAMAESQKSTMDDTTAMLCFRTMTGTILLYDHVNPRGAFHKKSPIMIRNAVVALKSYTGKEKTDSLINALRFNTIHLNDEDTPSPIKALLA